MKNKRQEKIIRYLSLNNNIDIKSMAQLYNVSEMTIRRDLKEIEDLKAGDNYNIVKAVKTESVNKLKIGKEAAKLIKEDDIIFLDTGTTTTTILEFINDLKNLTVQSYNVKVLNSLSYNKGINMKFVGGVLHHSTQMCESVQSVEYIKENKSRIAFMSAAGVHPKLGISCGNSYEVLLKQTVIRNSDIIVLLIDSSKFDKIKPYYYSDIHNVNVVITDKDIPQKWIDYFTNENIELIITA